jgi:hypothetical protein
MPRIYATGNQTHEMLQDMVKHCGNEVTLRQDRILSMKSYHMGLEWTDVAG